jgi:hypothetical protein
VTEEEKEDNHDDKQTSDCQQGEDSGSMFNISAGTTHSGYEPDWNTSTEFDGDSCNSCSKLSCKCDHN